MGRVTFNGTLKLNGIDTEKPFIRTGKTKSGAEYKSFSGIVSTAQNNSAFVECFGMKQDTIKTMDTEKNKIEISWEDRKDDDVVESVAMYRKNIVRIGEDRYEFISSYDFVDFISKHYDELNGSNVTVTGQTKTDVYNGKTSTKFQCQNIYINEEPGKPNLKVTTEFYFNKESFDFSECKESQLITINGWTREYLSKEQPEVYVPMQLKFDYSKIDIENEKHVKLVKFKLGLIGIDWNDGKPKAKAGLKSKYYVIEVIANYINGATAKEISIEDLTETQREAIELGMKTLEDFQGTAYGDRVTMFKLVDYNLTNDKYTDGYVEVDDEEFENKIFCAEEQETVDEVVEKAEEKSNETTEEESDDELDSLFD